MPQKIWYEIDVSHKGLGKYRHIRGTDRRVVEQKAIAQQRQWDNQWQHRLDVEAMRQRKVEEVECERERKAEEKVTQARQKAADSQAKLRQIAAEKQAKLDFLEARQKEAENRTVDAQYALNELTSILAHTLTVDDTIQWDQLKNKSPYLEAKPEYKTPPRPVTRSSNEPIYCPVRDDTEYLEIPPPPIPSHWPKPPDPNDPKYRPRQNLLTRIFRLLLLDPEKRAQRAFERDNAAWQSKWQEAREKTAVKIKAWQVTKDRIETRNAELAAQWEIKKLEIEKNNAEKRSRWLNDIGGIEKENIDAEERWRQDIEKQKESFAGQIADWEYRKEEYIEKQREANASIDQRRESYLAREPDAVRDYCDMVLANSEYPDGFPQEFDLDYQSDSKMLIIEYAFPVPEIVPTLSSAQYVKSKDDFKEFHIAPKERAERYDALLYQIVLRTIHEVFEADVADALDAVIFNGLVTTLDKAKGRDSTSCILTVQASKLEFMQINLAQVDPKICFKSLKGVAAASLSGLAAVAPILQIDKSDRRFVDSYSFADNLSAGDNLATMDWEDFEHLIRELFEKEFSSAGGEVRVTQASRDGGVDAVVFDPDPIRGGKIVIQAKRYANTVGVSAVRDLYGTMINEGAMKGILVTTANYGPDAYEFTRGKPLTLLNGANLLHLLEKHGHNARINLAEAKASNASR